MLFCNEFKECVRILPKTLKLFVTVKLVIPLKTITLYNIYIIYFRFINVYIVPIQIFKKC